MTQAILPDLQDISSRAKDPSGAYRKNTQNPTPKLNIPGLGTPGAKEPPERRRRLPSSN